MTRYIESLPQGLDSHPGAQGKASLYRSMLDQRTPEAVKEHELPAPVADLLASPRPVSSWISEVHSNATLLFIQDVSGLDDEAYAGLVYDRMRALFDGPLYRILFRLSSPRLLIRSAAIRWRSFHRGTSFAVDTSSPRNAVLDVEFPPFLWNEPTAMGLVAALRATLDMSGAIDPVLELSAVTPTRVRIVGRWGEPG